MSKNKHAWWQEGIIYEVYIRSFKDSNGDGIGDIKGVLQKLDYIKWLGVNTIWITPFYPSPMKDLGYDVSDYTGTDPVFGTMEDVDELISQVHKRNMKLVIDLVPNHTSDQHAWFKESRSSKDNSKRNWYLWKDAKPDGSPPNNWLSVLGGSAWEWDEQTGQYYYHAFLKEQPDLNLRNKETMDAILNVMRFWLDKGVDGFRVDVMWHLIKDELWRNNPANPDYKEEQPEADKLMQIYSCDQPEVHGIIKKMRGITDEYNEKVIIGELYLTIENVVNYYGEDCDGAHLPSNFELIFLIPWEADRIGIAIDKYEAALPEKCWPNWVLGNHDKERLASRIGNEQAKIAAMLLLTLRGTPTIYYGDEIGLMQSDIPKEEMQDPQGLLNPGKNLSRDPQRSPMQWDNTAYAGFSDKKPWLRLNNDADKNNVEQQKKDPNSLLNFYKQLIDFRNENEVLKTGDYFPVGSNKSILAYKRKKDGQPAILVVLNFTNEEKDCHSIIDGYKGEIIISTNPAMKNKSLNEKTKLSANEGLVAILKDDEL